MKSVNIVVNGRNFSLACKPEEEEYLMKLAEELDQRASQISQKSEPVNDSQMLIMIALSILDELKEKQQELQNIEKQMEGKIVASLQGAAQRIEKLADNTNT